MSSYSTYNSTRSASPLPALSLSSELNWEDLDAEEMSFVVNLQDSNGQLFYLHENNTLISMNDEQIANPLIIQLNQLETTLNIIRQRVLGSSRVYGIPTQEFTFCQIAS